MSDEKKLEAAKQYVDKQLATMKKYDAASSNVSEQEYKALIQEVAANVQS